MRIAVISDIHGNFEALDAVIRKAERLRADHIACLGDIVGYGPYPGECAQYVYKNCATIVRGNHDMGVTGELPLSAFDEMGRAALAWTIEHLGPDDGQFLRSLPSIAVLGDVTLVHASPLNLSDWRHVRSWPGIRRMFRGFSTEICCVGHTHFPYIVADDGTRDTYRAGRRHIINVGSVGQPRDGDPRASFCILDTVVPAAEIVRVEYNVEATAAAITHAGLPEYLGKRLQLGK